MASPCSSKRRKPDAEGFSFYLLLQQLLLLRLSASAPLLIWCKMKIEKVVHRRTDRSSNWRCCSGARSCVCWYLDSHFFPASHLWSNNEPWGQLMSLSTAWTDHSKHRRPITYCKLFDWLQCLGRLDIHYQTKLVRTRTAKNLIRMNQKTSSFERQMLRNVNHLDHWWHQIF